ncbi:MAG: ABC transporter permease [Candidatus Micrarchaeota archaeon]
MKLFDVMKMEVRFISAQGFTSLLILLYPFVLMFVVGPVFTSIGSQGALIAVYSESGIVIPKFDTQSVEMVYSQDDLVHEVLSGRAVLGVSIVKDASGRSHMYSYFEPTKEIVANALALQLQGKLSDVSANLVETNLVSIWQDMRTISSDIDSKLASIPKLRASLGDSRRKMQELGTSLESQRPDQTRDSLVQMQSDSNSMLASINEMQGRLSSWEGSIGQFNSYDSRLAGYDVQLASTHAKLSGLRDKLYSWDTRIVARISQLDSAYNTLSTYRDMVRSLLTGCSGAQCSSLSQIDAGMTDSMNQISSARSELASLRSDISAAQSDISNALSEIAAARSDISSARAQMASTSASARNDAASARASLNDASNRLSSVSSRIAQAINKLDSSTALSSSITDYLSRSASELDSLLTELDSTESLLLNAKRNIGSFTANDPRAYIPLKFEPSTQRKQLRSIDAIFPALLALVSMLSCLLLPPMMAVKQKSQGLRMRMRLSYANPSTLIFGRFLGDYAIGLVQVLVVTLVGSMVFGINLGTNYLALAGAILLAPAVFTAMGTLLASFVSNEGSAVLSSLLVSMPMLFLSGILLPLEQIQGSFRTAAELLPLYNVVEMLSKVTIRDSAQYASANFQLAAIYLAGFLALAYLFWRNKE